MDNDTRAPGMLGQPDSDSKILLIEIQGHDCPLLNLPSDNLALLILYFPRYAHRHFLCGSEAFCCWRFVYAHCTGLGPPRGPQVSSRER